MKMIRFCSAVSFAMAIGVATVSAQEIKNTAWRLASSPNVTITFSADGVNGFNGCNRFFGSVNFDGIDGISMGPLASTKRACSGTDAATERTVMDALARSARYERKGDQLILKAANGVVVLELAQN